MSFALFYVYRSFAAYAAVMHINERHKLG